MREVVVEVPRSLGLCRWGVAGAVGFMNASRVGVGGAWTSGPRLEVRPLIEVDVEECVLFVYAWAIHSYHIRSWLANRHMDTSSSELAPRCSDSCGEEGRV